jgi:hypothetical protein
MKKHFFIVQVGFEWGNSLWMQLGTMEDKYTKKVVETFGCTYSKEAATHFSSLTACKKQLRKNAVYAGKGYIKYARIFEITETMKEVK